ncbi:sporulation-control protein [Seinonella peptonophila]|uniref:Sporulation-control protein n=1 Tax=Seinonella peptonophila TaxID=112248 RepID=A0A1M4W9B6_9BACL|nr:sporulation protein [Seinonella peptonophila]SHE77826.1 sporulation-control protein [Seinonella peptonophila]
MFETLLAGAGIGSARIDLILDKAYVKIGQTVTGKILVTGGKSEQKITGLSVLFCMESAHAKTLAQIEEMIAKITVTKEKFLIKPGEEKVFPFSFLCPESLPVSSPTTKYFFDSNLEIDWGRDSHDRDYIDVWPIDPLKTFLESFTLLGLKRTWEGLTNDGDNWLQWKTYCPSSHFSGHFEELIFCIESHNSEEITGYYQVDLQNGEGQTLIDTFHLDEKVDRFHFTKADLASPELAKKRLTELIKSSLNLL